METPKYQVVVKLPTGERYEFEKWTDLRWEDYENQPGRCTFSVPTTDPKLLLLTDTDKFVQIYIYRNSTLVWQGFLAFTSDDINKTDFYGLSLLECLKWYRVGYNTAYTTKKIGTEILSPIWDIIDAKTGAILGDLIKKGTFEDPYQTSTTTAKTITRTVFDEDFFTLCEQMIAIARADSPASTWIQESVMAVTLSETAPTFSFKRNVGANKTTLVYELDSEISDFIYTKDYRFIRNDIKGMAIVSGPQVIDHTEVDTTSRTNYYLREIATVYEGISTESELDEKVKNDLKDMKDPEKSWYLSFTSKIAPYEGYVMGDNLLVRINRGRVNLNSYFRVVGMEVTVENGGVEITHPILQQVRT